MGAQCSGGISAPKLGAQLTIGVGSAYIAQLLELTALAPFMLAAPLLVIPEIALNNFCSNDPPAYTTLTPAESNAILQLDFSTDFFTGVPKLIQIIERLVWFDQCYCQTGTLVPNGAAPPPPTGTFEPVPLTPAAPTACYGTNPTFQIPPPFGPIAQSFGVPAQFMSQATRITIDETVSRQGGGDAQMTWNFGFTINNNILNSQSTPTETFTGTTVQLHEVFEVPVGATDIFFNYHITGTTGSIFALFVLHVYCGTGPNAPAPCCPPDPITQAQFDAIINLLNKVLKQQVTPRLPLYADSTIHPGVSGNGSIVVDQKSVAMRVDVTSDLTNWPANVQIPTYYFSMGFITSLAIMTPIKGWRLVYQHQTFPLAAECDEVSYSLPAGITANLTELVEVVAP